MHPLRAARLRRSLTQEMLAVKSGLSSRTLQNIEADAVKPLRSTMRVLADALHVAVEDILPTNANGRAVHPADAETTSDETARASKV